MRAHRLLMALAVLIPSLAFAGDMPGLDLRSGVPAQTLSRVMGQAYWLLCCALVVGLILEGLGKPANREKDIAGVVFRFLLMLVLLKAYGKICGTVVNTAQGIANSISPAETWQKYAQMREAYFKTIYDAAPVGAAATPPASDGTMLSRAKGVLDGVTSGGAFVGAYVGGALFDGLMAILIAIGQASQWVFAQLSQVVLAFFYVVGPLAIAANVPLGVNSAGKWFRTFVTVACWPIASALLLALSTQLMFQGHAGLDAGKTATAWGALASTLFIVVLNLSVPVLCSAVVGGAVGNIVTPALSSAFAGAMGAMAGARASAAAMASPSGPLSGSPKSASFGGALMQVLPRMVSSATSSAAKTQPEASAAGSGSPQAPTPPAVPGRGYVAGAPAAVGPARVPKPFTGLPRALRDLPRPPPTGPRQGPPPLPVTSNARPKAEPAAPLANTVIRPPPSPKDSL